MTATSQPLDESPRDRPRDVGHATSLPGAGRVALDVLVAYAQAVLDELAANRDVKCDDAGRTVSRMRSSGITPECTWQMFDVDFSGIGMATDMPLIVHAFADAKDVEWNFESTPIASTPRSATPKAVADTLDMNVLLDGFRRFVTAESVLFPTSVTRDAGSEEGPILIDRDDCTCWECGGSLELLGVADTTMSVECENGHAYDLTHDGFEAGFDYVLEFLSRRS